MNCYFQVLRTGIFATCPERQDTTNIFMLLSYYILSYGPGSSEFGTYRLCEQRRFRRACASAQSRQNLRCSLIQALSREESSDRKPDPWPLWMTGHAQLKFVMTECSKTQIHLTRLIFKCDRLNLICIKLAHHTEITCTRTKIGNQGRRYLVSLPQVTLP